MIVGSTLLKTDICDKLNKLTEIQSTVSLIISYSLNRGGTLNQKNVLVHSALVSTSVLTPEQVTLTRSIVFSYDYIKEYNLYIENNKIENKARLWEK